jgi:enoyl-CoA hydratase
MILSSRVVSAQEAVEIGLVNSAVAPDEVLPRATEIAMTIAGHGPAASRYVKEAVLKGLDMTLAQGMRLEADLSFILQSTSDRAEGLASFLERRPPTYRGE